jgi:hypothetical protein
MKKTLLYVLAFVGILSIFLFIFKYFLTISGQTMYRGPAPIHAFDASPNVTAPVALQSTHSVSEGVMRGMIIRNANITLQVNDVSHTLEQISQLADKSGGYIVNSNLSQDNYVVGNNSANISIRIPAEGLNSALAQLKSFANKVVQESVTGEDISQQYVNLESQLKNLQTTKEQLTRIMDGAKKTSDVLNVYKQLSDTQGQIDVIEGQMKYYKQSVAYSLITINLTMNPMIANQTAQQWKLTEVAISAYHELVDQLRNLTYGLIQFIVYFLPLILIWTGICLIAFWVWRKIYFFFKG